MSSLCHQKYSETEQLNYVSLPVEEVESGNVINNEGVQV